MLSATEVMRQIDLLDTTKSNSGCIPTRILKAMKEMVCPFLTDCMNSKIYDCNFSSKLKEAELYPLFKNGDSNHKDRLNARESYAASERAIALSTL